MLYMKSFLIPLLVVAAFAYADPEWNIETVVSEGIGGWFSSIQMDSSDQPHIVFGREDRDDRSLMYAHLVNDIWDISVIDNDHSGAYSNSLQLDSQGNPHVAYVYYDQVNIGYARYAYWDGNEWHIQNIDPFGSGVSITSWSLSLALDSQDHPHIVYWPAALPSMVVYTCWDGNEWKAEYLNNGTAFGFATAVSIALDGSDVPHVAVVRKPGPYVNAIYYDTKEGDDWVSTSIGVAPYDHNTCVSIVLEPSGLPHIATAFGDESTAYVPLVTHYYKESLDWAHETVIEGENLSGAVSIVLDSQNRPCISSYTLFKSLFWFNYSHWDGSMWNTEHIEDDNNFGYSNSLALDSQDQPHVAYNYFVPDSDYDYDYDLKYAWYGDVTAIGEGGTVIESPQVILSGSYPSPASELVTFSYSLPVACSMDLSVYDLSGRCVTTLVNSDLPAGQHDASWICANAINGVYFVRLKTDYSVHTSSFVVSR